MKFNFIKLIEIAVWYLDFILVKTMAFPIFSFYKYTVDKSSICPCLFVFFGNFRYKEHYTLCACKKYNSISYIKTCSDL